MTLASASVNSLGAFLPAWAFQVGLSPGTAGLLLAGISALCIVARIGSGLAADRRRGRNLPVVAGLMALGAIGLVLLSLANLPSLVAGAFLAFAIGWSWPGLMLFGLLVTATSYPTAWRTAAAVLFAAAVLSMVARRLFLADLARRPPRRPLDTVPPPVA